MLVVAAPIVGPLGLRLGDPSLWSCRYGRASCIVDPSPAVALLLTIVAWALVWACVCAWLLGGYILAWHAWRLDRDRLILAIGTALVAGAAIGALRFAAASNGRLRDAVALGAEQALPVTIVGLSLALLWAAVVAPRLRTRAE